MPYLAVDTETTGLNPALNSIFQLAVVLVDVNFKPYPKVRPFQVLIKPYKQVDSEAIENNTRLYKQACEEGYSHGDAVVLFERWVDSLPIKGPLPPLGYNYAAFDLGFLKDLLTHTYYQSVFSHHIRDVFLYQLMLDDVAGLRQKSYRLGDLCEMYGIKLIKAHNAYDDIVATIKLYEAMVNQWRSVSHLISSNVKA